MKPPIPGQPYASGHKVYVLLDPRFPRPEDGSDEDYEIRYVGRTRRLRRRLYQHLRNARLRRGNDELGAWIRELGRGGERPRIALVTPCATLHAAQDQEAAVIGQLRRMGYRLCNRQHNTTPTYSRWPRARRLPRGRRLPKGRRLPTGRCLRAA